MRGAERLRRTQAPGLSRPSRPPRPCRRVVPLSGSARSGPVRNGRFCIVRIFLPSARARLRVQSARPRILFFASVCGFFASEGPPESATLASRRRPPGFPLEEVMLSRTDRPPARDDEPTSRSCFLAPSVRSGVAPFSPRRGETRRPSAVSPGGSAEGVWGGHERWGRGRGPLPHARHATETRRRTDESRRSGDPRRGASRHEGPAGAEAVGDGAAPRLGRQGPPPPLHAGRFAPGRGPAGPRGRPGRGERRSPGAGGPPN